MQVLDAGDLGNFVVEYFFFDERRFSEFFNFFFLPAFLGSHCFLRILNFLFPLAFLLLLGVKQLLKHSSS